MQIFYYLWIIQKNDVKKWKCKVNSAYLQAPREVKDSTKYISNNKNKNYSIYDGLNSYF